MAIDLSQLDTIQWLRYGYLAAAYGVILIAIVPSLRDRFLAYGARSSEQPLEKKADDKSQDDKKKKQDTPTQTPTSSSNPLTWILDQLASYTVPHDWFLSFYFLSLTLCAFWPGEILGLQGPLWRGLRDHTTARGSSMSFSQLQTTWAMLLVQSGRRLYECLDLPSSSESQMFVGHWIMGLAFYAATSVAVWIEGLQTLQSHTLSTRDLVLLTPSPRTILSTLLFLLASGFQHDVHAYLAHLKTPTNAKPNERPDPVKTYKLPSHPAFSALVCPHYTAEIVVYLAMAINAAPVGAWVNGTLGCALVFVGVNLGVTAYGTRQWYRRVFGEESVRGRWNMIPLLY